jgi:hypothetical protein
MGETPRRSGFRLPWGDTNEPKPDTEPKPDEAAAAAVTPDATEAGGEAAPAATEAPAVAVAPATPVAAPPAPEPEPSPFLRELVDAMRGVADTSRETSLADLRTALDQRIEELRAASAARADDLRRRSEHDVTTIGEWERTEIDRVRAEAEQRREARGTKLDQELADAQAASDREVAVARQKLTDYERELASFFAELASIEDPGTFVATAKRMPPPPDLGGSAATNGAGGASPAAAETGDGNDAGSNGQRSEKTLSERLAQLDQQLAAAAEFESPAATSATPMQEAAEEAEEAKPDQTDAEAKQETAEEAEEAKPDQTDAEAKQETAEEAKPAAVTPEAEKPEADKPETEAAAAVEPEAQKAETEKPEAEKPAAAAAEADALTPIVVKGLGSFGAITSFKQALERVDGVRGVTLSLGPTGEFVYRASHATEFDIVAAIRQIEGPSAGIEQAEGQVLVTVERQR